MVQSRAKQMEARFDAMESRFDRFEARMEELFRTVQDSLQRLNSRIDFLENRGTTRTEKGYPRNRDSSRFGTLIGTLIRNTAEKWCNLDLQSKLSNLEKTVPAEEEDASNSAANTAHLHRDTTAEDDVSISEKGEEQGFLQSATAEIGLCSGASREEQGTRGSVTGGEKRQNVAGRYGGGDRRSYGFGRPCSIVAKPPPLLAAVLPWGREDERRTLEVDGVTMAVEDRIRGRRNMLRRAANDKAEIGEAAAASGFCQTNGVRPDFLLTVGGFAAAQPWKSVAASGLSTITTALILLCWSGSSKVTEAHIFGLIVGSSSCKVFGLIQESLNHGPTQISLI